MLNRNVDKPGFLAKESWIKCAYVWCGVDSNLESVRIVHRVGLDQYAQAFQAK